LGDKIEKNETGGACSVYGGEKRRIQDFCGEKLRERDPDIGGRIILIQIFRKWGCGLDQAGSGQGQVADTCERGNEPSGSVKCREYHE
jgi:hypothetical protein